MIALGVVVVRGSGFKYGEQGNACDGLLVGETCEVDMARHAERRCMERLC